MKSMVASQRCAILVWAAAISSTAVFGQNATNSWTSLTGGNWHDLTWSLGVRPDISQGAVVITNDGQKTVIINPITVSDFPQTLVISNLALAGTATSTNTLVLDHTGLLSPLQVFDRLAISNNAELLNLGGAISVQGSNAVLVVNGFLEQGDGWVSVDKLKVGAGDSYLTGGGIGHVYLTNGTLTTTQSWVGCVWGNVMPSVFEQYGGVHVTHQLNIGADTFSTGRLPIEFAGIYRLSNGLLSSDSLTLDVEGSFFQTGGTNIVAGQVTNYGTCTLSDGHFSASSYSGFIQTAGNGTLTQSGGFAVITNLSLGGGQTISGYEVSRYTLDSGYLSCSNLNLAAYGSMKITGGNVLSTNITLEGPGTPQFYNFAYSSDAFNLKHLGGTLTNVGQITFAGGVAYFDSVTAQLGAIMTAVGTTSIVSFAGTSTLRFDPNPAAPWPGNALLYFRLPLGDSKIYVGDSQNSLTPEQLSHIRFGLPGDTSFNARLLNTGELVPDTPFFVSRIPDSGQLEVIWPQNWYRNTWTLQSANVVTGPYYDVFPAPGFFYVTTALGKEQYFRLRNGALWSANDIGVVALNGSATTSNGVWNITGDGTDIWGTTDGFQFAYQPWNGDGSITARVLACQPTDPYAKAGVMFRASLDPSSANYATVVNAQSGSQSQWRTNPDAQTSSDWFKWSSIPYWVKVSRRTNTFLGSISSDGTNWTVLTAQDIPMIDPIYAGLAVSSHTTNSLNTATLDNVSFSSDIAPLPWANADVGNVYFFGNLIYSNGTFTVTSFGFDCWSTADQFQCIYQPLSGDTTVTVHIASMQNGDPWAKAGVMLRSDMTAGARYSASILTPANGTVLQRRYLVNNGTAQMVGPNLKTPCWLRIVRQGNAFYNYASNNGTTWTLIGNADTINMGTTAYAVLFATTHTSSQTVSETAAFDSISITQP